MNRSDLFAAIRIAVEYHDGQVDKAGVPYIAHCIHVMSAVRHHGFEAMIVGVLHDVVEDTEATMNDVRVWFAYSTDIVDALDSITRRDGESYNGYISRLQLNKIATIVKVADLAHNLQGDRGKISVDLWKRYRRYYDHLCGVLREEHGGVRTTS